MKSFQMGISYLRQEALASGFLADSDNDDKLIERLAQVVRKLGPEDAEQADRLTAAESEAEPETKVEVPEIV